VAPAPKLTAIVLTRHPERAAMLEASLASFRAQTLLDAEALIVNDGAPIACLAPRVRVLNLPPGRPVTLGEKRNVGLREARSPWIATWDDDDVSLPQRLTETLAAAESGGFEYVKSRSMWVADAALTVAALYHGWCLPTAVFRREVALEVGGYPHERFAEDFLLYDRFIRAGRRCMPELWLRSYVHRRHASNVSALERGESLTSHLEHVLATGADEVAAVNAAVRAMAPAADAAPVVRPAPLPPPAPDALPRMDLGDLRNLSPLEALTRRMRGAPPKRGAR